MFILLSLTVLEPSHYTVLNLPHSSQTTQGHHDLYHVWYSAFKIRVTIQSFLRWTTRVQEKHITWWYCWETVTFCPVRHIKLLLTASETPLQFPPQTRQICLDHYHIQTHIPPPPPLPTAKHNLLHYMDLCFAWICSSVTSGERSHEAVCRSPRHSNPSKHGVACDAPFQIIWREHVWD